MGQDPLSSIIQLFGQLYVFIVVLRFLLQIAKADYYNPICQAVVKITAVPLTPLQRVLPRPANIDLSPLLLAFLINVALWAIILLLKGQSMGANLSPVMVLSGIGVLNTILDIYFYAVIGAVIISWVAPGSYHPGPQLIVQLTEPLFALARRVIPSLGGLDLSPILIFFVIQIARYQLGNLTHFLL
ncbi:YggT family protein [Amphritea pacifica]|uniref:YggT family protein n=1 Tax=Amphritea pacifica TaxID=2811233 RepID=A0ABS2WAN1_9GAMM|nr:YggT family protein [Amphritea pacifica]MBN0988402.1 YggT family protein [Amphritea pacifica]MBN1006658.1 YggT family protein [Amphritea pacifica]